MLILLVNKIQIIIVSKYYGNVKLKFLLQKRRRIQNSEYRIEYH